VKTWKILYGIGVVAYVLTILGFINALPVRTPLTFATLVFCLTAGAILRGGPREEPDAD